MIVEDYKIERLLKLLNTAWGGDIKGFTVLMTTVLIGNIYAVTLTCTWLHWSCRHLIGEMKRQIQKNYEDFNELFVETDKQSLDPPFKQYARRIYHNQSILKAVWQLKNKSWMTVNIREELKYMKT